MTAKPTESQNISQWKPKEIHGKKGSPRSRSWMLLFALIIVLTLFGGSKVYDRYVIFKHEQVVHYMDEVYSEYREVNLAMSGFLKDLSERSRVIPSSELQAFKNKLTSARIVFDEARVPKYFEEFHAAAKESFFISLQLHQALEVHISSRNSQYKMINLLITERNHNITSAKNLLEDSFKRSQMMFEYLDDEQFQFWYVSDKSLEKSS
ncbi:MULTISPECIES: hypothetical protein [unclassified Sporosarcina]|uniref:hypothetical protein n=1 Tax=unclassified Sporosarcina TaxID=2647733 RepID=UPI001A924D70|nr:MULTISPECIES: hypothetical protein [unclassified Sporosarcina]MBO0588202.1 hypothetical protein [Sporosarcina sp. E16_8]MBO0601956.1 hypothetical protein [Sporosarcina sp. E16_3]